MHHRIASRTAHRRRGACRLGRAVLCATALAGAQAAAVAFAGDAAPVAPYVRDEVIVQFHPGVDGAAALALVQALGLTLKQALGTPGSYLLRITDGTAVPQAIARLQARPEVQSAEPNYLTHLNPPGAALPPLRAER